MRFRAFPVLFSTMLLLTTASAIAADVKPAEKPNSKPPSRLLIRSGTLVSSDGVPIQLHDFEADIADDHAKGSQHLGSKIVVIRTGYAFLSNDALSRLLTDKLKGHNLENIKVSNDKGEVKITGKAKKGVTVPFTIQGRVSLTDQGYIRLETRTEKVAHLPKGLADLLGMNPEKLAGDGKVKGVSADKNSISFDPDLLWGLPVHGQVAHLTVERNGLLLVFGAAGRKNAPPRLRAKK